MKIYRKYEDLDVVELILDSLDELYNSSENYMRISIPSDNNELQHICNSAYKMVDRTVLTSINLLKNNFDKNIRLDIKYSSDYKDEIIKIAYDSFKDDFRFNLANNDINIYEKMIKGYIDEIDGAFVCFYKEKPIGFIQCCNFENRDDEAFINLAAIDERYRLTGAALSLYSYAAKYYKERGYRILNGRISTKNISVMNLYSFLGAKFSKPYDIYIKRVIK